MINPLFSLTQLTSREKVNARKKPFFIQDDTTDEDKEIQSYYRSLLAENAEKEENERLKTHLCKGKLVANNTTIVEKIQLREHSRHPNYVYQRAGGYSSNQNI